METQTLQTDVCTCSGCIDATKCRVGAVEPKCISRHEKQGDHVQARIVQSACIIHSKGQNSRHKPRSVCNGRCFHGSAKCFSWPCRKSKSIGATWWTHRLNSVWVIINRIHVLNNSISFNNHEWKRGHSPPQGD